jgi:signal transduction histidine kinase
MNVALLGWALSGLLLGCIAGAVLHYRRLRRDLRRLSARAELADAVAERAIRSKELAELGVRTFTHRYVMASEAAFGHIAGELHDVVAQPLMLARFALSRVPVGAGGGRPMPGFEPEDAVGFIEEAESAVRGLMSRVRVPRLDGGFGSVLTGLLLEFERRYGLTVTLEMTDDALSLNDRDAMTAYRFTQETLMNVVKHADVDTAAVGVQLSDGILEVTVTDDGVGFDPAVLRSGPEGHHVGIELLRDRAAAQGGTVSMSSALGSGTTVTLRLLVRPE